MYAGRVPEGAGERGRQKAAEGGRRRQKAAEGGRRRKKAEEGGRREHPPGRVVRSVLGAYPARVSGMDDCSRPPLRTDGEPESDTRARAHQRRGRRWPFDVQNAQLLVGCAREVEAAVATVAEVMASAEATVAAEGRQWRRQRQWRQQGRQWPQQG
eukprot:6194881-Prymnesium_polylepis.1